MLGRYRVTVWRAERQGLGACGVAQSWAVRCVSGAVDSRGPLWGRRGDPRRQSDKGQPRVGGGEPVGLKRSECREAAEGCDQTSGLRPQRKPGPIE